MGKVARQVTLFRQEDYNGTETIVNNLHGLLKEAIQPHVRKGSQAQVVVIVEVIEL